MDDVALQSLYMISIGLSISTLLSVLKNKTIAMSDRRVAIAAASSVLYLILCSLVTTEEFERLDASSRWLLISWSTLVNASCLISVDSWIASWLKRPGIDG